MAINSESTPPPRIGKIGPYTVFMTPPSTPNSTSTEKPAHSNLKTPPPPPVQSKPVQTPPPVQQVEKTCPVWSPPMQYEKPSMKSYSSFGFFWNALAKVQNAHASLDEHVAYWFGLNQSKYQWALDDYYENKGISQAEEKAKAAANKLENV